MEEIKDKYYYFPTMTKNIMFVRGQKYICLSDNVNKYMKKGESYTLYDFENNNFFEDLKFINNDKMIIRVSACDVGSFTSLKKQRQSKLTKLNKKWDWILKETEQVCTK
jgi:hypothetical protein